MLPLKLLPFLRGFCLAVAFGWADAAHALTITLPAGSSAATINGAINHVSAAGGGIVRLAAGSYKIASSILMNSNVTRLREQA